MRSNLISCAASMRSSPNRTHKGHFKTYHPVPADGRPATTLVITLFSLGKALVVRRTGKCGIRTAVFIGADCCSSPQFGHFDGYRMNAETGRAGAGRFANADFAGQAAVSFAVAGLRETDVISPC